MTDQFLGQLVRKERTQLGLTQIEFAKKSKVGTNTVRKLEQGIRPKKDALDKILYTIGYQIVEQLVKIEK